MECYLVAIVGKSKGALVSVHTRNELDARRCTEGLWLDIEDEYTESACIDIGAKPGLWIEGDPAYIRSAVEAAGESFSRSL
jgi:hypothetical protein